MKANDFLEIVPNELSPFEKDECKILISEYLNDSSKDKRLKAKNANQLFFIIDFLIEYISNKERVFKEKMTDTLQVNKELNQINLENELKFRKYKEILETNPQLKEDLIQQYDNKNSNLSRNVNNTGLTQSSRSITQDTGENQIKLNQPNLYVKTLPKKRSSEIASSSNVFKK